MTNQPPAFEIRSDLLARIESQQKELAECRETIARLRERIEVLERVDSK
jgi:hypothetical protein